MFWKKKNKDDKYTCSECGEIHEEWPALAYSSPSYYDNLPDQKKEDIAELDEDFCIVKEEENTYYFIRVVLNQKVKNHHEDLQYGLWVSLSEKSFKDYQINFKNESHETGYFGWLSSFIQDYDNSVSIPMDVQTKKGNERPEIIPHKETDHRFVRDYYDGITGHEAQRRVDEMIKNVG